MTKINRPRLRFSPQADDVAGSLSAAVLLGDDLWVASDESTSVERLTTRDGGATFDEHCSFALQDFIDLPARGQEKSGGKKIDQEVDVEGLDYSDGYLWLTGSHSIKRKKLDEGDDRGDSDEKNISRLSKVDGKGNRFILARVPLVTHRGENVLRREARGSALAAAQLPCTATGNELTDAIAGKGVAEADPHLAAFLHIPGKDNGFDVEGLAVSGNRIFLGLRGPVLRGWAVVLEVQAEADRSSDLRLKKIGPHERPYRKHFLDLGGLGVRDLCWHGRDLLVLAGPSMNLDGPVFIFRWKNAARVKGESVVWGGELADRTPVPYSESADHAEGMTLAPDQSSVLVVFDSPGADRKIDGRTVYAEVLELRL